MKAYLNNGWCYKPKHQYKNSSPKMYPMNQCIGMFALFFDSHLFTLSEKKEKK